MGVMGRLTGRRVLITGVSRRVGIAYTLARQLGTEGARVVATGWAPADAEQPWGSDDAAPPVADYVPADLADPDAPQQVVAEAARLMGGLDVLLAVHARSSTYALDELTAAELDLTFAINTRATLLLVKEFAATHSGSDGRVITFSSGQHRASMPAELPYAASKAALQQLTPSLAAELAPRRITVNCINPGPVDTGYADEDLHARVAAAHPRGRWGMPEDLTEAVVWLCSASSDWVTGQTIDVDGGWSIR